MRRKASSPGTVTAVVLASAVTVVDIFPMFLTGALAVQLQRDLGFDRSHLGIALGVFLGVGSLFSVLSGRTADRIGPAPGMRNSTLLAGASALFIAVVADSWNLLVVGLVLGGLANALGQPSANIFLSRFVSFSRQGLAFGIRQSAAPIGTLLGGLAVPAFALTVGWRWAFVAAALVSWIVAGASAFIVPRDDSRNPRKPSAPKRPPAAPLRRGPLVVLAVASGFGFAAASALTGFLVDAAVTADFDEATAGLLLSVGGVTAIATRIGMGFVADRRSGRHLAVVAFMLTTGAFAFVLLASESKPLMVLGTIAGFGMAWGWSGLFFFSVVRLNPQAAGRATGVVQTGAFFGGVAGPLLFGLAVELWGYRPGWLLAGAWAVVAGSATWIGARWDRRLRSQMPAAANP